MTLTRLHIDPSYFRRQAIAALARKRDNLIALGEAHGWTHRIEAMAPFGDRPVEASVRDELARTDRAIQAIEAQTG